METTRHFTATVYVVADGAVALHEHDRLGMWLPPGGHLDRDELPHEAAKREVREEIGQEVTLLAERGDVDSPTVEPLPEPRHVQLADVNACDGEVGHQHIDHVFYARAEGREIDPGEGEAPADAWQWFDHEDLAEADLQPDVVEIGRRAIEAVADDAGSL
jgi:8-oxo-dGTP pyrophosphatase MutT (NUDIX family)